MAHPRVAALGIDLGTTYSCVAVVLNGKVEVVANDFGARTTPSVVGFIDGEEAELVGDAAASQAHRNPENVVWDAKRMVGRPFSRLQPDDVARWPFSVAAADKDKILIRVTHNDISKSFSPEEISAKVVKKMKDVSEAFLGYPVNQAVITVPAYFNSAQRAATRKAGALAGLTVHRTVPEPSAAALAYAMQQMSNTTRRVLVYDLGGGTFDVTVANVRGCLVTVRAVGGDSHLGGQDFDNRIFDHIAKEIERKTGRQVAGNPRKARRLLTMCERLKQDLSAVTRAELDVLPLIGEELPIAMTRAKFEDLTRDLLNRTRDAVADVLQSINMDVDAIDEVVLVGGSTRMPAVHRLLADFFPGTNINKSLNPDEAVAYGAAALAARLAGDRTQYLAGVLVNDVTPISFGLGEEDGGFSVLIPRNTPIPFSCSRLYLTVYDHQDVLSLKVYQGERTVASRNAFIGEYRVEDLPRREAGLEVEVRLSIDSDGVLTVEARHPVTRVWGGCTVQTVDCTAFGEQVPAGTPEVKADDEVTDRHELARLGARFRLSKYLHDLAERRDTDDLPIAVVNEIKATQTWMDAGQYSKKDYVTKFAALRRLLPGSGRRAAAIANKKFIK
ncbi:heat shock 70 kDa protein II-like isoform X2 [Thrips palmi]|nr:heat shock 70 kDa protein II-like isoform X2 [Thrips palmi]XP_034253833.1 heat shock 70 kDa protein II-like isoform X2 [Thrips palmi]